MSDINTIVKKLEKQDTPRIVFTDIDGTLFSPNLHILTAPFTNLQTAAFLKSHNIPFVVVTGRSFWRRIDQYHLRLLGVPMPDIAITANGTIIYNRQKNTYVSDFTWQGIMQSTKVTNATGNTTSWNKWEITNTITDYLEKNHFAYYLGQGNTYLIRIRLNTCPVTQVEQIKKDIVQLFPKGIRIILTEKLLWKNTLSIFSGELLITPNTAGKDKAVQYVLKQLSSQLFVHSSQKETTNDEHITNNRIIHAFVFGDATVDVPMLTMKEDARFATLSQYGIHPTPLAQKVLEQNKKINPNVHILYGDGPKEIFQVLSGKREALSWNTQEATLVKVRGEGQNFRSDSSELRSQENFSADPSAPSEKVFSPAQNNKARQVIRKFEWVLDRLVDKNLSPNEISFLGLQKVSEGLKQLSNTSFIGKAKGWYNYSFGNLTDILDGIRARKRQASTVNRQEQEKIQGLNGLPLTVNGNIPGYIVDGFADRAKEFMQLYARARKREALSVKREEINDTQGSDESITVQTFLAALSCALPSIARAQVEISGKTVAERDEKGGSMIDRTKKLFLSLVFDNFGLTDQSLAKDLEIYTTNMATFKNRLLSLRGTKQSQQFNHVTIQQSSLSPFQKKALERFLLYVDVLQQENEIVKKYLAKYPKLLREYKNQSKRVAKIYLVLPIGKLRKKWEIKDYKLQIEEYL